MTKEQEIIMLELLIKRFGPNSYIGPFLEEHREDIIRAIRADFPINCALNFNAGEKKWLN